MEKAMTNSGRIIHATFATKGVPYLCACCGGDVIFAAGEINRWYFRHRDAKARREVLLCEKYVSQLGNDIEDTQNLYESELDLRSHVRLEIVHIDQEWKLHLRFPSISPEFHEIIDQEQLYFKIYCKEELHEVSSIHLQGLTGTNYKLPVRIRDRYTLTTDNPILVKKLKIQINGTFQPFKGIPLLFKFIQGCLLHVPYSSAILGGRFMILSPYNLLFPTELTNLHSEKLEEYILYDCYMPDKVSSNLMEWFSRTLRIKLFPSTSHIDLLTPTTFRLSLGLVEVSTDSVSLLLTHLGAKPTINWISIIDPNGQRKIICQKGDILKLQLLQQGTYSIDLLNLRGERFEVRRVPTVLHKLTNPLSVTINGKQVLFNDVTASGRVLVSANCSLTFYSADGASGKIIKPSDRHLDNLERLHIPFIWSVVFLVKRIFTMDTTLSLLLQQLEQRGKYREVYLGPKEFQQLNQYIHHSTFKNKNRLLMLLNMRRGFVPLNILSLLRQMEE